MSEPLREERREGPHHDRRANDPLIERIDQKLTDFLQRFDEHIEWANRHFKEQDDRLILLERIKNKVEQPVKWIGWTVVVTLGGGLVYLGQKIAVYLENHWH